MTLLRAASRTMLASYFVASGVKALRDPDSLVPVAEPLADRLVPLVKQYAPRAGGRLSSPRTPRPWCGVNGGDPGRRRPRAGHAARAADWARCCWPGRWCPAPSRSTRSGAAATRAERAEDRTSSSRTSACSAACCSPRGTPRASRASPGGRRRAARRSPRTPARPPTKLAKRAERADRQRQRPGRECAGQRRGPGRHRRRLLAQGAQAGHQAVRPGPGGGGEAG